MMNYHAGRCCCSPNSVGMVVLCSVANHFRMTHTGNTDERHDPIYLEWIDCRHTSRWKQKRNYKKEKNIILTFDRDGPLKMIRNRVKEYVCRWQNELCTGQVGCDYPDNQTLTWFLQLWKWFLCSMQYLLLRGNDDIKLLNMIWDFCLSQRARKVWIFSTSATT